ncbi:MAG TPA: hexitol phosphatase HxpB [Myxococcales bacterium]|nr:hexitol phosphatase HxpB [Myxococcales bacterium]HIK85378.1 hexitol phosphatase HxpB [Myxococcales bacterium]
MGSPSNSASSKSVPTHGRTGRTQELAIKPTLARSTANWRDDPSTSRARPPLNSLHRALIFDMDGVLIDSEPLWRRAEIEIFASVGLILHDSDCRKTQGLRIDEAVSYWHERSPWSGPSCSQVSDQIVARVAEHIRREGQLMKGAQIALDWAASSSWRIALASSSTLFLIETTLDQLGIRDYFEVVRSAENEAAGKPHPDVYLGAARDLRLEPGACTAIEDSANGVAAALAAGMRCLAIPSSEDRDDPRFSSATAVLSSLDELEATIQSLSPFSGSV